MSGQMKPRAQCVTDSRPGDIYDVSDIYLVWLPQIDQARRLEADMTCPLIVFPNCQTGRKHDL